MKTEITHTPEEAARWFKGLLKNEQDRRRCLELLNEHYPEGLPENPNEEINALLYHAFPQLWGKNVGELSFAQRYPLIRDALAYQQGITERVSPGQPTTGKDDGMVNRQEILELARQMQHEIVQQTMSHQYKFKLACETFSEAIEKGAFKGAFFFQLQRIMDLEQYPVR